MNVVANTSPPEQLKRLRNSALLIVMVSVLACELPLLLAMFGLGEALYSLPAYFEVVVYTIAAFTLSMLLILKIYRWRFRKKVQP